MKKLVFRFDIDTHKCIRSGVSNLLDIADYYDVRFTFFLNMGRSISLKDSICSLNPFKKEMGKKPPSEQIQMMSALQKLGIKDYLEAAILNPQLTNYKKQLSRLLASNCEVGIHGGRNHAIWHQYADGWTADRLESEIKWVFSKIQGGGLQLQPKGFASPGWTSPAALEKILKKYGFSYCADYRCQGKGEIIRKGKFLDYIGVNLLGEPGGVAFFENCRVKGYSTNKIIDIVLECINRHEMTVMYDHPYYAGIHETECIKRIIEKVKEAGAAEICTLGQLI